MSTTIKFVFVCATVLSIFAGGSVLMSLISTGTKAINTDVSNQAASYSSTFLLATFLFGLLLVLAALAGAKRKSGGW
jgi:hypothetical protein